MMVKKKESKKKSKSFKKKILGIAKTGVVAGAASSALGFVGGTGAVKQAVGNASSFLPAIGSTIGAGALLNQVNTLEFPKKKKKGVRKNES